MKTIIIAEAGVNHNGDVNLAKKMVDVAAEANVDYIKFQTFKAEEVVSIHAKKADYQKENVKGDDTQYSMIKKLELSQAEHMEIVLYCNEKKVKFMSTPFDLDSIDFLASLDVDYLKIPSGEITNYPYLVKIAKKGIPVILSTGMCEMDEIATALDILTANGIDKKNIILLHCNTEYPTPMKDVNLRAMITLHEVFGVPTGYSDHTRGIEVSTAAVALGARVIEKHFTLDNTMEGPDHKASLNPEELRALVKAIRNVEQALGSSEKHVSASEAKNMVIARKSLHAKCAIKAGEEFTEENLTVKRPGNGISPMRWNDVIGTKAKKDFNPDDLIEL